MQEFSTTSYATNRADSCVAGGSPIKWIDKPLTKFVGQPSSYTPPPYITMAHRTGNVPSPSRSHHITLKSQPQRPPLTTVTNHHRVARGTKRLRKRDDTRRMGRVWGQGNGLSCSFPERYLFYILYTVFNITTLHRNYTTRGKRTPTRVGDGHDIAHPRNLYAFVIIIIIIKTNCLTIEIRRRSAATTTTTHSPYFAEPPPSCMVRVTPNAVANEGRGWVVMPIPKFRTFLLSLLILILIIWLQKFVAVTTTTCFPRFAELPPLCTVGAMWNADVTRDNESGAKATTQRGQGLPAHC